MKQVSFIKIGVCATLFVSCLSGCQKVYDYVASHPGAEIKSCGIREIVFPVLYSDYTDTLTFHYNAFGDPVKVTRPQPRTGAPNFLFKYKNGRLTEFIGVYHNGTTTENWHKYSYDPAGRVLIDSVYIFAEMVNGVPENPFDSFAITFTYDSKDRIINEKHTYSEGSTYEQSYQYNSSGNRIGGQYGQNVSFRRTNKIWMMIDRDYSINDRLGSSNFNSFHMPTVIQLGNESVDYFLGNYFTEANIAYLCK